jgi:excisionase family DNA binding protein/PAS domain S-box-containing protein
MEKTFFSTPELARWIGVFHTTVRRWIEQGKIKGIRVGRNYKIPAEEVISILDRHHIPLPDGLERHKLKLKKEAGGSSYSRRGPGSILQKLLVVEDIEDPALICRKDSILGVNQAFANLVGHSQADLIGADITEVIDESSEERLIDFAQRRAEEPEKGPQAYVARLKKMDKKKVRITGGSLNHVKDIFLLIIRPC